MGRWLSLLVQVVGWLIGGFLVLVFVAFVGLTATSAGTRWRSAIQHGSVQRSNDRKIDRPFLRVGGGVG